MQKSKKRLREPKKEYELKLVTQKRPKVVFYSQSVPLGKIEAQDDLNGAEDACNKDNLT